MKLLIVGSDLDDAIENHFVKYLRQQGVDLLFFPAHTEFYRYYYAGILHKILFRAGLSGIYRRINKKFRRLVEQFQPQVIWVFKGMELFPESLEWAKTKGIKLANYNPDNPFIFTGKGSGNGNVTRAINIFDLQFTYNLDIKKELEEKFPGKTVLLPFGFDIDGSLYDACAKQEEIGKLCFLGNPDSQRAEFIRALAAAGVSLDVYGRGWDKWLNHPNVRIFGPVYKDEMWKVLRKYRVQLNLLRIHNLDSHNMRTFEVPAIGGIMLAPDTKEHRLFFRQGEEVFLFGDLEDCVAQVGKLINMPAPDAILIRARARERSISSGYSYAERAKQVWDQLRALAS